MRCWGRRKEMKEKVNHESYLKVHHMECGKVVRDVQQGCMQRAYVLSWKEEKANGRVHMQWGAVEAFQQ